MNLNELFLKEGPQTVSFCWGRFQPPHRAHGELFNKLKEVGTYDYWICASQSTGPKDPLDYATKMKFIRLQHPKLAQHVLEDTSIKQVFDAVTAIYNKYDPKTAESLTLVFVGDKTRVGQFVPSFQKYNGVQGKHGYYKFGMITGATTSRDVDSDADAGISDPNQDMSQINPDNISGSLVRNLAATNQFEKFATTVSKTGTEPWVKDLYAALGGGAPEQGVAEATFKKSPYGRTAASQQRARELLNPPKPSEPKKDEKKEGVAVEPDPTGYQKDLLTTPKNSLVIDTPGDLDWYKLGQHYPSLGTDDPHEYGQSDSDMMIVPFSRQELDVLKQRLDRLKMRYKEIGGGREQPEIHDRVEENNLQEHKKGVKAMKYTVKARNPVAKNAMSTIGGGGAGAHKDKKKASKQGDHKHKKQLVDLGESWNIEMSKVVSKLWK
jgi:hypothetical protein